MFRVKLSLNDPTIFTSFDDPTMSLDCKSAAGKIELFRLMPRARPNASLQMPTQNVLFFVSVPSGLNLEPFKEFCGGHFDEFSKYLRVSDYRTFVSILVKLKDPLKVGHIAASLNDKKFKTGEVCKILTVDVTNNLADTSSDLWEISQLPTCVHCLGRLSHYMEFGDSYGSSGISTMDSDSHFQGCSCATYPIKRTCLRCSTSVDVWSCLICHAGFCGRKMCNHVKNHWEDSKHSIFFDFTMNAFWNLTENPCTLSPSGTLEMIKANLPEILDSVKLSEKLQTNEEIHKDFLKKLEADQSKYALHLADTYVASKLKTDPNNARIEETNLKNQDDEHLKDGNLRIKELLDLMDDERRLVSECGIPPDLSTEALEQKLIEIAKMIQENLKGDSPSDGSVLQHVEVRDLLGPALLSGSSTGSQEPLGSSNSNKRDESLKKSKNENPKRQQSKNGNPKKQQSKNRNRRKH